MIHRASEDTCRQERQGDGRMALLIREEEVRELVTMAEAADAVEEAFRQFGECDQNPRGAR